MGAWTTRKVDVLVALNYYAPYVSGLTEVAKVVAEGLVARGHRVTVVTCRHDPALPSDETINGVRVVRAPILARIGKGLVSPAFARTAIRLGREADVVHLHLPMLESGLIAARLGPVPIVVTYHCDVSLPRGPINALQSGVMDRSNRAALRRSRVAISTSKDYAEHSRLRAELTAPNAATIAPPTQLRAGGIQPSAKRRALTSASSVGWSKRRAWSTSSTLSRAIDDPDARLLIAGDYRNVAGGSVVDRIAEAHR